MLLKDLQHARSGKGKGKDARAPALDEELDEDDGVSTQASQGGRPLSGIG
jgi:hypothetical protein